METRKFSACYPQPHTGAPIRSRLGMADSFAWPQTWSDVGSNATCSGFVCRIRLHATERTPSAHQSFDRSRSRKWRYQQLRYIIDLSVPVRSAVQQTSAYVSGGERNQAFRLHITSLSLSFSLGATYQISRSGASPSAAKNEQ
jgi:hypothetical protein